MNIVSYNSNFFSWFSDLSVSILHKMPSWLQNKPAMDVDPWTNSLENESQKTFISLLLVIKYLLPSDFLFLYLFTLASNFHMRFKLNS